MRCNRCSIFKNQPTLHFFSTNLIELKFEPDCYNSNSSWFSNGEILPRSIFLVAPNWFLNFEANCQSASNDPKFKKLPNGLKIWWLFFYTPDHFIQLWSHKTAKEGFLDENQAQSIEKRVNSNTNKNTDSSDQSCLKKLNLVSQRFSNLPVKLLAFFIFPKYLVVCNDDIKASFNVQWSCL